MYQNMHVVPSIHKYMCAYVYATARLYVSMYVCDCKGMCVSIYHA